MPDPPSVGFFTRFVLENPYPLMLALGAVALTFFVLAIRDGRPGHWYTAGVAVVIGFAVLATGLMVTTPAEHGEAVTREFVQAVVDHDVPTAMSYFSPNASFTIGSPNNPGQSVSFIQSRLIALEGRYPIQSNRITSLRGYTEGPNAAIVHLRCRTDVAGGYGLTPSEWVLRVQQDDNGDWKITQLTAISIASRTPSSQLW